MPTDRRFPVGDSAAAAAFLNASSLQLHRNMHSALPQCVGATGFDAILSQIHPNLQHSFSQVEMSPPLFLSSDVLSSISYRFTPRVFNARRTFCKFLATFRFCICSMVASLDVFGLLDSTFVVVASEAEPVSFSDVS